MFSVFTKFENVKPFLEELNERTRLCYKSGLEHISRFRVPMLDVTVCKQVQSHSCCLRFEPFFKPSNRALCLSRHSMHARSVHSWPVAEMYRLASLSRTEPAFLRAQEYLIARFRRNMIDTCTINQCIAINPFRQRTSFLVPCPERVPTAASIKSKIFTLVLPYHPVLMQCGLYTFVRETFAAWKPVLSQVYDADVSIRIAWCNAKPPLYLLLRRCN